MNPVGVSSWIWLSPFTDADAPSLVNATERGLGSCDLIGSALDASGDELARNGVAFVRHSLSAAEARQ